MSCLSLLYLSGVFILWFRHHGSDDEQDNLLYAISQHCVVYCFCGTRVDGCMFFSVSFWGYSRCVYILELWLVNHMAFLKPGHLNLCIRRLVDDVAVQNVNHKLQCYATLRLKFSHWKNE